MSGRGVAADAAASRGRRLETPSRYAAASSTVRGAGGAAGGAGGSQAGRKGGAGSSSVHDGPAAALTGAAGAAAEAEPCVVVCEDDTSGCCRRRGRVCHRGCASSRAHARRRRQVLRAGQGGRVQAESRLSATAASLVPLLSKRERAGWVADGYDGGSMEKPYSGGATVGAGARSAEGCACELQEPRHVGSAAGSVTRGAAVGCFVSSGSGTEGVAHEEREAQGPSGSKAPEVKGCAGERPGAGEARRRWLEWQL